MIIHQKALNFFSAFYIIQRSLKEILATFIILPGRFGFHLKPAVAFPHAASDLHS